MERSSFVTNINFAGGEPFLNKAHVGFLRSHIDRKTSAQISLSYNTNLTLIPVWLNEIVPYFKEVHLRVSVDDFGELNSFIRHPSNWKVLTDNLNNLDKMMAKHKGILTVDLITTVQIYNILYLDGLLSFLIQQDWQFIPKCPILIVLHNPDFMSVMVLVKGAKQLAAEKLQGFVEKCQKENNPRIDVERISKFSNEVQKLLQSKSTNGRIQDFLKVNSRFDQLRRQNYFKIAPEMAEFLKEIEI